MEKCILTTQNGSQTRITDYKLFPEWIEESEKLLFRRESNYISATSLPISVYEIYENVDDFICIYSENYLSVKDFAYAMEEHHLVEMMLPEMQGKVFGKILKNKYNVINTHNDSWDISKVCLLTNKGVCSLKEISELGLSINDTVEKSICNISSEKEIERFAKERLFFMICVNTENGIKYRMVIGRESRKTVYRP